jgi:ribokinase
VLSRPCQCVTSPTAYVLQGANQAVAAARLSTGRAPPASVHFICRFGNDSYAVLLQQQLTSAGVDVSGCVSVPDLGSGQGLVMLEPDGAASSIVVGGANTAWSKVG